MQGLLRNWHWNTEWCHSNTTVGNTQVQKLDSRNKRHCHKDSTGTLRDIQTRNTERQYAYNVMTVSTLYYKIQLNCTYSINIY